MQVNRIFQLDLYHWLRMSGKVRGESVSLSELNLRLDSGRIPLPSTDSCLDKGEKKTHKRRIVGERVGEMMERVRCAGRCLYFE